MDYKIEGKTLIFNDGIKTIEKEEYPDHIDTIVIPDSVKGIADKAFCQHPNLRHIKFSTGLKYIGTKAFSECNSLEEVEFPEGVKDIGEEAFSGANCACGS